MNTHLTFLPLAKKLTLVPKYVVFACAYGLISLLIPFTIQYLVNNLALSGIWTSTLSFLVLIATGLVLTQLFRLGLVLLSEAIQREIFVGLASKWSRNLKPQSAVYFFEVEKAMVSFAKAKSNFVELGLLLFLGLSAIVIVHPVFVLLPLFIGVMLTIMLKQNRAALGTSLHESQEKYRLHHLIEDGVLLTDEDIDRFLRRRDTHFGHVRRNHFLYGLTYVVGQFFLLATGLYLLEQDQMSVGQLVAAEIILSGIFSVMAKFPQALESYYDFETSQHKIAEGLKGGNE